MATATQASTTSSSMDGLPDYDFWEGRTPASLEFEARDRENAEERLPSLASYSYSTEPSSLSESDSDGFEEGLIDSES